MPYQPEFNEAEGYFELKIKGGVYRFSPQTAVTDDGTITGVEWIADGKAPRAVVITSKTVAYAEDTNPADDTQLSDTLYQQMKDTATKARDKAQSAAAVDDTGVAQGSDAADVSKEEADRARAAFDQALEARGYITAEQKREAIARYQENLQLTYPEMVDLGPSGVDGIVGRFTTKSTKKFAQKQEGEELTAEDIGNALDTMEITGPGQEQGQSQEQDQQETMTLGEGDNTATIDYSAATVGDEPEEINGVTIYDSAGNSYEGSIAPSEFIDNAGNRSQYYLFTATDGARVRIPQENYDIILAAAQKHDQRQPEQEQPQQGSSSWKNAPWKNYDPAESQKQEQPESQERKFVEVAFQPEPGMRRSEMKMSILDFVALGSGRLEDYPNTNRKDIALGLDHYPDNFIELVSKIRNDPNYPIRDIDSAVRAAAMMIAAKNGHGNVNAKVKHGTQLEMPSDADISRSLAALTDARGVANEGIISQSEAKEDLNEVLPNLARSERSGREY